MVSAIVISSPVAALHLFMSSSLYLPHLPSPISCCLRESVITRQLCKIAYQICNTWAPPTIVSPLDDYWSGVIARAVSAVQFYISVVFQWPRFSSKWHHRQDDLANMAQCHVHPCDPFFGGSHKGLGSCRKSYEPPPA